MNNIINIWRKEIMDSLRDRKALRQAILIPLIIGLLYAVMNPLLNSAVTARSQEPVEIRAQGIENAGRRFWIPWLPSTSRWFHMMAICPRL